MVGQLWDNELRAQENMGQFSSLNSNDRLLDIAHEGLESSWSLGEWTDFKKYV